MKFCTLLNHRSTIRVGMFELCRPPQTTSLNLHILPRRDFKLDTELEIGNGCTYDETFTAAHTNSSVDEFLQQNK